MLAARGVRPDARDALEELGTAAIEALRAALGDASTPHKVRVHIPRTLSRFAVPRVVEILLEQQSREQDGLVRFKIIRALDQPVLVTALGACAGTPELEAACDHILTNISQRMAQGLREEMAALGSVKEKPGEEAQNAVIAAIRELEASGDLALNQDEE